MTFSSLQTQSASDNSRSGIFDYYRAVRRSFSYRQTILFYILLALLIVSSLTALEIWNKRHMVAVPAYGGIFSEGVLGTPRFVNPVLALSDADRDLVALMYSGLLRVDPQGEFIADLASSYAISEDGLTYTFKLRNDNVFHDGQSLTSDDVRYTIERAQDPVIKSPRRASWEGVTVETPDPLTVILRLRQPYAPFLENLTMGILPKHLWKNSTSELFAFSELNLSAVGSGPYKIGTVKKSSGGTPQYYELVPFNSFSLGTPRIQKLRIRFFDTEEARVRAYTDNEIDAMSAISPEIASALISRGSKIATAPLPRTFGVFLNQNQNKIFSQREVRQALEVAIGKERVLDQVLSGFGTILHGPLPPGSLGYKATVQPTQSDSDRLLRSQALLQRAGWKLNENTRIMEHTDKKEKLVLRFTLSTVNTPELTRTAELLAEDWKRIGAEVDVKTYELGDLNQNVIRPRKFDALLFGEIIGRDPDLFSFWHSSQRNDPGLNVALYTNIQADKLLEKMRLNHDPLERLEITEEFTKTLASDSPAIFLYAPSFIYALPSQVQGVIINAVTVPSERFLNVYNWYIEEEYIWPFFRKYI